MNPERLKMLASNFAEIILEEYEVVENKDGAAKTSLRDQIVNAVDEWTSNNLVDEDDDEDDSEEEKS